MDAETYSPDKQIPANPINQRGAELPAAMPTSQNPPEKK